MSKEERRDWLGGVKIEITFYTDNVKECWYICSSLDLFRVGGVETTLHGHFSGRIIPIEQFMDSCHLALSSFKTAIHETNDLVPSIRM